MASVVWQRKSEVVMIKISNKSKGLYTCRLQVIVEVRRAG